MQSFQSLDEREMVNFRREVKERMTNWKMYSQIQRYKEMGFSKTQTRKKLRINFRTVRKYWEMPAEAFTQNQAHTKSRSKKPDVYRKEVLEWIQTYPDISAAQLYDWLQEKYEEKIDFSERTFRDYIRKLRIEEKIPKSKPTRQYEAVNDPPMGYQAQVDMGEQWVITSCGKRKKLYCFAMVLSHSRQKYAWWQTHPFTTETFVQAHEKAFLFYGGKPKEIAYDQDKVLAVSENYGDILFTNGFQRYWEVRQFKIYLCRKSDPESKGRIEAVVKYVKNNFAKHRTFTDIESFNDACLEWLQRRGNGKKHEITQKVPAEVFLIEKDYLTPVPRYEATASASRLLYHVRKDNTVLYKTNRYQLPKGTYQPGKQVQLTIQDASLVITDKDTQTMYARHTVSKGKGQLIQPHHAKRELNKTQSEMVAIVCDFFGNTPEIEKYLGEIQKEKPRYFKDQLSLLRETCEHPLLKKYRYDALVYCMKYQLYSAVHFTSAAQYYNELRQAPQAEPKKRPLLKTHTHIHPKIRDIREYIEAMRE